MIVIGVDAHKRTHTMVAVDAGGRQRGEKTIDATSAGHLAALRWAYRDLGPTIVWAVEDSRAMTAHLERDLLDAGQRVIRVPTQLVARTRTTARRRGKSDPIDALAAARAALREPDLPVASHNPWSRELKLLIDRRDHLVQQRTATVQRLLYRVHELDPTHRIKSGALNWRTQQDALSAWLAGHRGLVAELARDELADITRLTPMINAIEKRLTEQIRASAPSLVALYGCGVLTAARIIGEVADIDRFKSEAAFARYAGLAPIPDWSGSTRGRLRSYRGGNRQLNAALHQIAMTRIKKGAPSEYYYRRRRADRDAHAHAYAINGVKRRLARTVFTRLRTDRGRAPLAPFIAELARRNEHWANLIPPSSPPTTARRTGRRPHRATTTPPLLGQLTRMNQRWAAELAAPHSP